MVCLTRRGLLSLAAVLATAAPASATTKGLNQIVTPDIQPKGQISISLQAQHPAIGNGIENQIEVGLTKSFELAAFYGYRPGETILNGELGLYAKGPCLLSTGFTSMSTRGSLTMGFLEGGYYKGKHKCSLGAGYAGNLLMAIVGYGFQLNDRLLLQADYLSGSQNFATAGFTFNLTPSLTINPALYIDNTAAHKMYGYGVLAWTIAMK